MIIARRELTLDLGNAKPIVAVEISAPELRRGAWICDFSVGWPDGPDRASAAGADSAQALYLAFQKVAVCLYASAYHKAGKLVWDQPGGGYGFILPSGSRHFSIGTDKKL